MRSILITGSAGFIGYHLTQTLLDQGHEVYGVDNLVTGQNQNIELLQSNPRFHFISQDVSKLTHFEPKIDLVLHFASPASPVDFERLSLEIALVNSQGTYNMLQIAQEHSAYFVFASTSEVYGEPEVHPQVETYFGHVNPIGLRSPYDESKRFGEMLTADYWRKNKVKGNILRIFNTYGPNMRINDGRVVSNFIHQSLIGEALTVVGNGQQTRSMCYVSDLVESILLISDGSHPNQIFNIGNDDEVSVLDLANKIIDLTKSKSDIIYLPKREDEPTRRKPDLAKVNQAFNWRPKVSLEQGILQTIKYFQKNLNLL